MSATDYFGIIHKHFLILDLRGCNGTLTSNVLFKRLVNFSFSSLSDTSFHSVLERRPGKAKYQRHAKKLLQHWEAKYEEYSTRRS